MTVATDPTYRRTCKDSFRVYDEYSELAPYIKKLEDTHFVQQIDCVERGAVVPAMEGLSTYLPGRTVKIIFTVGCHEHAGLITEIRKIMIL